MNNSETIIKYISQLLQAAEELVNRVDHPEKIPDTCYRGDVSRWNFGYFLSRREKLGADALRRAGQQGGLAQLIAEVYGDNSPQLAVYKRALALCSSYSAMYDLEIKDM